MKATEIRPQYCLFSGQLFCIKALKFILLL